MILLCLLICLVLMLLIAGVDQLLRRKVQRKRTRQEKQSLTISVACVPAYVLMSVLGLLLVIADTEAQTQLGGWMYEAAVMLGRFNWLVAMAAIVAGIVMRKRGNPQGAKLAQLAAMGYIAVFGLLCLFSGLL